MAAKTLTFTLIGKDGSASRAIQGVGRAAGGLTKVFAGVGAAIAGAFAVARIVNFAKATVTEFAAAQDAQNRLSFAFAQFPSLLGANIEGLRTLNEEMARTTKFDDDAFAAGQATLAQYGLTEQQLRDLTPLLADYAARTGKELPDAANDLGKAILGQGRALKEVGIDFQDAGSAGANFDQIVSGLRQQVGGFAASEGATFVGQLAILKNGFGEVKERIGGLFAPALLLISDVLYDSVLPALDTLVDKIGPDVQEFFENGAVVVGGFFDALAKSSNAGNMDALNDFFDGLADTMPIFAIFRTVGDVLGPLIPKIAEGFSELGAVLTSEGVIDSLVQLVEEALPPLVDLLIAVAPLIPPIATVLTAVLIPVLQSATGYIGMLSTAFKYMTGEFSSGEFFSALEALPGPVGWAFGLINDFIFGALDSSADVINGFISTFEGLVNGVNGLLGIPGRVRFARIDFNDPRVPQGFDGGAGGGAPARAMFAGGIVKAAFGGIPAVVGEGLYDEAVVPLSPRNLAAMSGGGGGLTVHVTVPGGFVGDERKLSQVITAAIRNGVKRGDIGRGWATT